MKKRELRPDQKEAMLKRIKESGAYQKAYEDGPFMQRKDLRAVRLQLELLKPELVLREHKIRSTVVVFGSARVPSPEEARQNLAAASASANAKPKDVPLALALKNAEKCK